MLEKIAEKLREYKDDHDLVITETTTFEELELDSLDTVDLVMDLEEIFGVTIEMSDDLKSVGDLMKAIETAKA